MCELFFILLIPSILYFCHPFLLIYQMQSVPFNHYSVFSLWITTFYLKFFSFISLLMDIHFLFSNFSVTNKVIMNIFAHLLEYVDKSFYKPVILIS